ncbi:MAG TPA: hypothetical protein K8U77_05880 [Slackia equolifaciens]|uniref:Uncharacterized protein n=1 Tax=Slackia equolifaciens TaxID=498718 RepID=A0A9D3A1H2_9ACTN|nr:hypothetical protein [Slackia equolifaciens]
MTGRFDDKKRRAEGAMEHDRALSDAPLNARVREAYERMTPSVQAEERMLAALIAAQEMQAEKSEEDAQNAANHQQARFADAQVNAGRETNGAAAHRRVHAQVRPARTKAQRAAIALAACLAAAFIGIGALVTMSQPSSMLGASAGSSQSAASSAENENLGAALDGSANEEASAPDSSDSASSSTNNESGEPNSSPLSSDQDVRYPHIALDSGIELEIAHDEYGVAIAAAQSDIASKPQTATVSNDLGETAECHVYESTDESPYPYVVSFDDSGQLFFAQPA